MAPIPILISSSAPSSSAGPPSSICSVKNEVSSVPAPPKAVAIPQYRHIVALPFELREHCQIYFEEAVYTSALNLLLSSLTGGALPPCERRAVIAPPHFLSFMATLAVHPILTSRAKTIERADVAALSLRYLRTLLNTVGPVAGRFGDGFVFISTGQIARGGRTSRRRTTDDPEAKEESAEIRNDLADVNSLWQRGEDFWHIVGWAFNCSVLHKRRWEVWATWLEFMLELLETDWMPRTSNAKALPPKHSIIASFVNGNKTSGFDKRILRALLADGSSRSANEFREIWPNETKSLKKEDSDDVKSVVADPTSTLESADFLTNSKPAYQKIDIEADNYGNYLDDEVPSDLSSISRSPSPDRGPPTNLGGSRSIHLRLRLLSLLCSVSASDKHLFVPIKDLYDLLSEHIRSLPLPIFASIVTPSRNGLGSWDTESAQSLVQFLLRKIIDCNAPEPPSDHLDQDTVMQYYLPFAANANGVVENAKVSLCVEFLVRILEREGMLSGTRHLRELAEIGVEKRRKKASAGRRGKGRGDEQVWLEGSAGRILGCVMMAIARAEREGGA